ncbi:efflux RND transporter periplasmic adaptor subunit [Parahaliea mediterranea]|uniref:Efflux RND transporter periplasmic adaptor subunit n=1 Tax=Parahaliea mediterranea TaxID=651086 RepID=A0A939DI85_9GAMM|nr:efflux RND transporter periplasmic adaptor subunit [Parahaliea mediterranea]MBN7798728.1 efflux RND transporter periplasmic adaptor subunit [Parahaliea mediterranea]
MNSALQGVVLALLLGGAGGSHAAGAPEAVVELASVSEGEAASVVRLPGTVISTRDAEISAEISGRLMWVARVGERVGQGDPVAILDDHLLRLEERDNSAEIARLDADIAYHQRHIQRLERLAEQNNMAQSELDQLRSQLEMLRQQRKIAEVALERTRYNLSRSRVAAPFDGVVAARSADEGEYLNTGASLLRLVDTDTLEISVSAPLRLARHNQPGHSVQVEAGEVRDMARIRGLVPVGDTRSRMMELRLALAASPWLIGEAVTVELPDSVRHSALRVPRDALVLRDGEVFVYTVNEDNTARKVVVTPGAGRGESIAIEGELQPGDAVVVRGAERLREGQALRVIQHHLAISP